MIEEPLDEDFVRVATCSTPTEAHLLQGVLQAAGIAAHVADAHIVQANSWMTQAVGGVRVLVAAHQAGEARQAIAEFNAGSYQLEDEAPPASVAAPVQPAPLLSPDKATLLSFILTPAFGAGVHLANTAILGERSQRLGAWAWFVVLACASAAGVVVALRIWPDPFVVFRASWALSFITVVWYFIANQPQSKRLLSTYGPRYKRRSLAVPAVLVGAAHLGLGWLLSEWG
jgi:hypothetical protein